MNLVKKDYELILKHYGRRIPRTRKGTSDTRKMKKQVYIIFANKLCRCIKAVQKSGKKKYAKRKAIAVCNKSIFGNRGLKHFRFTCKKKRKLKTKKGTRKMIVKTKKLHFKPKRKR